MERGSEGAHVGDLSLCRQYGGRGVSNYPERRDRDPFERPARPGTDGADRRQIFLAIANSTAFDATHAVGRDAEGFYIDAGHPANAATPTRGYFDRRRATGAFHNRHGDALYLTCR